MTFFSPWELLWGVLLYFWPITLGVIGFAAWFGYGRHGILRWLSFSIACLLAVTFLSGAVTAVYLRYQSSVNEKKTLAFYDVANERLAHPRLIQGQMLPVGTEVLWRDDSFQDFERADLPGPTPMLNAVFQGRIEHSAEGVWKGKLASNADIDNWPCAAGEVTIAADLKLKECRLAADHQFYGRLIPAGTELEAGLFYNDVLKLTIPAEQHIALPGTGLVVPGTGILYVHANGLIDAVATTESPLRFRGVPLVGFLKWVYALEEVSDPEGHLAQPTAITGLLGGPISCERQMQEAKEGKSVSIPWVGDEVEVEQVHVFEAPPANGNPPTVTHLRCDLLPLSEGLHVEQQK